jgi:hypothetical protein
MWTRAVVVSLSITCVLATACASEPSEEEVGADEASITAGDEISLLSANTTTWGRRFAMRASQWKAIEPQTRVGRLATPSPTDASLGIDYVYIPAKSTPTNLIVMNSGIHGVEAPAGVLFQDVLLGDCASSAATPVDRNETAILVIQAMNPAGAKYGRRFNASNVDLNRNFFDAETNQGAGFRGLGIANTEYRDLQHLLEGGRINIIDIGASWVRHGSDKMNKALSGQYEFPTGLYYGGHEVQPEAVQVQELVLSLAAPFKNMAVIDMHTGLGKAGINQIMMNPLPADAAEEMKRSFTRETELLRAMFPESECAGLCEVQGLSSAGEGEAISSAFVTTGDFTQWFHERFADKRKTGTVVSVTSEIGTATATKVLEALVDENFCHFNRSSWWCGESQYQKDVKRLREQFNPPDAKWQANVLRASKQMCTALGRFSQTR